LRLRRTPCLSRPNGCVSLRCATISDSRRDLGVAAAIGKQLRNRTFPDICHATQEAVDGVYVPHGTVRLLIGSLKADPPARTTKTISVGPAGNISGYIGTSILGAGTISLNPLFDRQYRLDDIEAQRINLLARIDGLPPPLYGKVRAIPEVGP
jgi:hypothetical protein